MNVTASKAKEVTKEVEAAIVAILSKHGLATPTLSTTYGDFLKITIKTSLETLNEDGVNLSSPEALDYETYGETYGLKPGLLGTRFLSRGVEYIFTGIKPSRPKFPICAMTPDGRQFKMTEDAVKVINSSVLGKGGGS